LTLTSERITDIPARRSGCRKGEGFDAPMTMAFQPIASIADGSVFTHEALVRGTDGRGAGDIPGMICERNR
jgi:EAL domain-containing protein (putative c-di-GMP-specific phosphodiesterase class I)